METEKNTARIGKDIAHAAAVIRMGGVVGIPTETVYGLGANAFNEKAVLEIFRIKNRPFFDPLIVHIHSAAVLERYVTGVDPLIRKLTRAFWPGPLTVLLPRQYCIPDLVTSGNPLVAIRVPDHPLTLALLKELDLPVAAPSANPFGYISPTTPEHVALQLGDKIPYILDGGACAVGLESTIVQAVDGEVTVLRLGGLSLEKIAAVTGKMPVLAISTHSDPKAPGQLDKHYSPRTPLRVAEDISVAFAAEAGKRIGLLSFRETYPALSFAASAVLSARGDMDEAATGLFAAMRRLDALDLDLILAEKFPAEGLGPAINDRLARAGAK